MSHNRCKAKYIYTDCGGDEHERELLMDEDLTSGLTTFYYPDGEEVFCFTINDNSKLDAMNRLVKGEGEFISKEDFDKIYKK